MKTDTNCPNYKVGDKYICIKDIPNYFIKDKTYEIIKIKEDRFILNGENESQMCFYIDTPYANHFVANEHFKDFNQIRKEKLEKINENWR